MLEFIKKIFNLNKKEEKDMVTSTSPLNGFLENNIVIEKSLDSNTESHIENNNIDILKIPLVYRTKEESEKIIQTRLAEIELKKQTVSKKPDVKTSSKKTESKKSSSNSKNINKKGKN
jgi:hypothetical protein